MKKTKKIILFMHLLMLAVFSVNAQQPANNRSSGVVPGPMIKASGDYTYRAFEAPNKMYGYDIFLKGRGIFHQSADIMPAGSQATNKIAGPTNNIPKATAVSVNSFLTQKEFAEKAALLSIEKIKTHLSPSLTGAEIQKALEENPIHIPLN